LSSDALENLPDFDIYFRPEYLRVSEIAGGGEGISLILGTGSMRALCPVLVRRNEQVADAFTPYGYGGLLWCGTAFNSVAASRYLFECLRRWCHDKGLTCCLLRLHPLLLHQFCIEGVSGPQTLVSEHGVTLGLDLSEWDTNHDRLAGLSKGRRSDLAVAKRSLTVEILEGGQRISSWIGAFREMYEATMTRLNSTAFYHFPPSYYDTILEKMGSHTMLALARQNEELVAASLFFKDHNFAHYHLSATTERGLAQRATTLILHEASRWARNQGCSWLHLGGGIQPYDGLHQFKASFGAREFPYYYVTVIADPKKYAELVTQKASIWPYSEGSSEGTAIVYPNGKR